MTITQLLKYLNESLDKIVNGEVIDTIYLDFANAFDTVPRRRLLHKLAAYGRKGNIQRWISAFPSDRSQVVVVNGAESKPTPVLSGIPQRSVLGPLLFVMYIMICLKKLIPVYCFSLTIKNNGEVSSADDNITLQHDLDSFERWSND